jgi:hypothetical protein
LFWLVVGGLGEPSANLKKEKEKEKCKTTRRVQKKNGGMYLVSAIGSDIPNRLLNCFNQLILEFE